MNDEKIKRKSPGLASEADPCRTEREGGSFSWTHRTSAVAGMWQGVAVVSPESVRVGVARAP